MTIEYSEWLQQQLDAREWTQADLARKAGISRATVSRMMTGMRGVGKGTLRALADAFDLPESEVFRAAGFLDDKPEIDEITERIVHLLIQVDDETRQTVLTMVEALYFSYQRRQGQS